LLPATTTARRIGVDNLGDKAMYGQCRLPEPGRLLRMQVRLF